VFWSYKPSKIHAPIKFVKRVYTTSCCCLHFYSINTFTFTTLWHFPDSHLLRKWRLSFLFKTFASKCDVTSRNFSLTPVVKHFLWCIHKCRQIFTFVQKIPSRKTLYIVLYMYKKFKEIFPVSCKEDILGVAVWRAMIDSCGVVVVDSHNAIFLFWQ